MTQTLADTLETLAKALPSGAIDQLTNHQRQLDMDGTFVGVSRQALDELLTFAAATLRERDGLRAHLESALEAIDRGDIYDRAALVAEVERLKRHISANKQMWETDHKLAQDAIALRADNERLRTALKVISENTPPHLGAWIRTLASDALASSGT